MKLAEALLLRADMQTPSFRKGSAPPKIPRQYFSR
jgi:hypothetical protein